MKKYMYLLVFVIIILLCCGVELLLINNEYYGAWGCFYSCVILSLVDEYKHLCHKIVISVVSLVLQIVLYIYISSLYPDLLTRDFELSISIPFLYYILYVLGIKRVIKKMRKIEQEDNHINQ